MEQLPHSIDSDVNQNKLSFHSVTERVIRPQSRVRILWLPFWAFICESFTPGVLGWQQPDTSKIFRNLKRDC